MNTNKLTAIIVDDEVHCRASLEKQLEWSCPNIAVVEKFEKPQLAQDYLNKEQIDILFLDIEMPGMNGFELLQGIHEITFDIIFTTAYDEFALRAFQIHATSYLLKPVDESELLKAIKLISDRQVKPLSQDVILQLFEATSKHRTNKIAIPTMEGLEFIDRQKIMRCAAEGNYTRLFITGRQPILISKTLKSVEELISAPKQFIRPHASHLVNFNFVAKYIKGTGGQLIMDDGFVVPVSKHKKQGIFDSIK